MRKRRPSKIDETLADPGPKKLRDDEELPRVFDLYWGAKTGADLRPLRGAPLVRQLLAEHGYDVKEWLGRDERDG